MISTVLGAALLLAPASSTAAGSVSRKAQARAVFVGPPAPNLRDMVLARSPEDLARIGRHVVAGYTNMAEIKRLIRLGAVGGVFVTARNAQDKSAAALSAEITELQEAARAAGHPRLIVAADQEGGLVTQLSPPLRRPPRLSRALRGVKEPAARRVAAYAIGLTSGRDLARVGVTLNLAPVVDLDHGLRNRKDKHSRIGERAISRDPEDVADVGAGYCAGLATAGVACTLKHFPGLGRVSADTHVSTARLDTTVDKLAAADWLPFQRVLTRRDVTVMIGHVTLDSLEPGVTASASRVLVSGVLRGAWGFDGLVLSDDLTMAAARRQVGGIGAVAVGALNAGVDVLLVTHATERIYDVLQALLAASDEGALDGATLTRARARIERFLTGPRVADHSLP